MKQMGLGRGLSALLKEELAPIMNNDLVKMLDISLIEAGEYQPRKFFEQSKIQELADSITNSGLLQPIIVSNDAIAGKYKVIAGERRLRACRLAGLSNIPVIVKNLNNKEVLEIALIENIQREGLSAIEEAEGYARLMDEFGYTQEEMSKAVGKSRSHIANLLRLNKLPSKVKEYINQGKLSTGHAKCLVGNQNAEAIAEYVIENELTVRKTEDAVKNWTKSNYSKDHGPESVVKKFLKENDPEGSDLRILASALSEKFGIKVTIENFIQGGRVTFHYDDLEKLDAILSRLG